MAFCRKINPPHHSAMLPAQDHRCFEWPKFKICHKIITGIPQEPRKIQTQALQYGCGPKDNWPRPSQEGRELYKWSCFIVLLPTITSSSWVLSYIKQMAALRHQQCENIMTYTLLTYGTAFQKRKELVGDRGVLKCHTGALPVSNYEEELQVTKKKRQELQTGIVEEIKPEVWMSTTSKLCSTWVQPRPQECSVTKEGKKITCASVNGHFLK